MHAWVNNEMVECIFFLTAWWTEYMLKMYWLFTESLTSLWSWKSSVFLLRFFSWLSCSFRRGSQVVFTMFQKCFLVIWKNRDPRCCCCLVSLAHKNKSVKLKKHKHKKSNVSRISVTERKREKYREKESPTFNPQFTIKRTIEIVHAFPGIFSFLCTSHASETTKTPEKA